MKERACAFSFLAILLFLSMCFVFLPKASYSETENRYLASLPEFSFESLLNGDFTSDFESWVSDTFPFRDTWIGLKSYIELLEGRKDTGGVYVTKDGYLIEMFTEADNELYLKNLDYVRQFKESFEKNGGSFDFMLVPTAAEVLKDKIGQSADISQKELLSMASDILSCDCLSELSAHTDEYIYYKTDHHWTSLGAYYGYKALMGENALDISGFEKEVLSEDFLGTTYSKAGIYFEKDRIDAYKYGSPSVSYNMQEESRSIYDRSYLEKKDKYSVFLSGNQPLSVIKTGNEGGKLLLIKDSYANCFVQFLMPHYSEIHVIDLRSFGSSLSAYIQKENIENALVLYNLKGFSEETSVFRLAH